VSTADQLASAAGGSAAAVVSNFSAAWAAHDLVGALALISEDCVFESTSPPDGERSTGPEAVAAAWKPIFDDQASQFTVEETIEAGDHVVQLWRYDWWDGHIRGVDVFAVVAGKITEKLAYVKG
jgi:ketosteroid isomerase-like protein